MYNEEVKIKFLDSHEFFVGDSRKKARADMISIFNKFEYYEQQKNADIAHFDVSDYPGIIRESGHPVRFSTFANTFRRLVQYKKFCIATGNYDPVLMTEYTHNKNAKLSLYTDGYDRDALWAEYEKYSKFDGLDISTPDKLYDILTKTLSKSDIFEQYPEQRGNCISLFELIVSFIILQFYGIDTKHVCIIKKDEIIIEKNQIIVNVYGSDIIIEGKFANLLKNMMDENKKYIIQAAGRSGIKVLDRNNKYPFAYASDVSDEDFRKRTNAYKGKFYKDMYNKHGKSSISLEDVEFAGNIYRMKKLSKNIDNFEPTYKNISLLYKLIGGKSNTGGEAVFEIINRFKSLDI